jgi:hemolysin III
MVKISRWINEPFCGLSHFAGAAASLAALIALLTVADGRTLHIWAFVIYGVSLILLFTASGLAHSIRCSAKNASRLDRLDYAGIFLLIAGTYTPLCLVSLQGRWGMAVLIAEWSLAAVGIIGVALDRWRSHLVRTILYILMGWLIVIVAPQLFRVLPVAALLWIFAGGVAYSVGAAVYLSDWPHPWRGRFSAHDLWHCLALLGSTAHFVAIFRYVA